MEGNADTKQVETETATEPRKGKGQLEFAKVYALMQKHRGELVGIPQPKIAAKLSEKLGFVVSESWVQMIANDLKIDTRKRPDGQHEKPYRILARVLRDWIDYSTEERAGFDLDKAKRVLTAITSNKSAANVDASFDDYRGKPTQATETLFELGDDES